MRKRLQYVALLFGMLVGLASCKEEGQLDLLAHTWKVDEWILVAGKNLPDSMKNEVIKNATMEFKSDSTFILKGISPTPTAGRFNLSTDGQLLTLLPEGSMDSYTHTIKLLTRDKMVLEDPSGNRLMCSH